MRYSKERGLSQRRACALMPMVRSGLYYARKMPLKDARVIAAMKDLSVQFLRFGARRIHVFIDCQGLSMSKDRCARIWSAAGLLVPARRKRKRNLAASRPRPMPPAGRNSVWC